MCHAPAATLPAMTANPRVLAKRFQLGAGTLASTVAVVSASASAVSVGGVCADGEDSDMRYFG